MAMKEWFRRMQPIQLYVILILTVAFFITELAVSHITHALTLLMDSYHTLCNIMALTGCIITMKYGNSETEKTELKKTQSVASSVGEELTSKKNTCHDKNNKSKSTPSRENQEKKMKNTFGWARIDVIVMLICCVFLASLCFSILVEALQTLVHIDHEDEMHHPIPVLFIGAAGLLLNGVCYLLIGGYTFHQGSFLYVTESGDVVLSKVVTEESLKSGQRRLSRSRHAINPLSQARQRQGLWEMTRDVHGCLLVIICALLIFFTDKHLAKFIDPIISIVSVIIIMLLSYPYIKESCLILLQTIPDTINIDSLKAELMNHFPDIVNIHDFHIWEMTAHKVISTVHIIFQNPKVYAKIMAEIEEFFHESGITQVTIQPEFFKKNASAESLISDKFPANCLMACHEGCKENHCCPVYEDVSIFKTSSKELIKDPNVPQLKSVRILEDEFSSLSGSSRNGSALSLKSINISLKNQINNALNDVSSEKSKKLNELTEKDETVAEPDKIERKKSIESSDELKEREIAVTD